MGRNLPCGVIIKKHASGRETVWVSFVFKGVLCRESLRIRPTDKNIKYADNLLAEIRNKIARREFFYEEYFPESRTRTAALFGRARSSMTVGQLFEQVEWENLTPKLSTAYTYAKDAKWAAEQLGDIPVQELTVKDIRDWIKTMSHLKRKTISNRLIPLRIVLQIAVDDQLIEVNPAEQVSLGKLARGLVSRAQRESEYIIDPFNEDEIAAILEAAERYHPCARNYFQAMFYTGMRPSEAKGLKWRSDGRDNVDFENHKLYITQAEVSTGGKTFKQTPKTRNSYRVIDLLPGAIEALRAQKRQTRLTSPYVFTRFDGGTGRMTHNDHYGKPWTIILADAGVRYRPPYQARHSYASNLLSGGENIAFIAEQMGHADAEMIIKRYGKWVKQDRDGRHRYVSDYGRGSSLSSE